MPKPISAQEALSRGLKKKDGSSLSMPKTSQELWQDFIFNLSAISNGLEESSAAKVLEAMNLIISKQDSGSEEMTAMLNKVISEMRSDNEASRQVMRDAMALMISESESIVEKAAKVVSGTDDMVQVIAQNKALIEMVRRQSEMLEVILNKSLEPESFSIDIVQRGLDDKIKKVRINTEKKGMLN